MSTGCENGSKTGKKGINPHIRTYYFHKNGYNVTHNMRKQREYPHENAQYAHF